MTTIPERMSVIETKVDNVAADVKEIKESLLGLDSKYAAKWVQTALAFAIGLIVAAVITALVALVVGPIRNATNPLPSTSPTPTVSASPQASTGQSGDKTVVMQPSNPSGSTQPSISPSPLPPTQPTQTNTQTEQPQDPGLVGNVLNFLGL